MAKNPVHTPNTRSFIEVVKPQTTAITTVVNHRMMTVHVQPSLIHFAEEAPAEYLENVKQYQQDIQCSNWYVAVQLYEDWLTYIWDGWFDSLCD